MAPAVQPQKLFKLSPPPPPPPPPEDEPVLESVKEPKKVEPHTFATVGPGTAPVQLTPPSGGAELDPTSATYSVGPPARPPIQHDNGFLQNPNDPSDPVPIPTVPPTAEDRAALGEWMLKAAAAHAVQGVPNVPHNDIPDGLAAYDHFLYGNGADRQFSYERFVQGDEAGAKILQSAIADTQLGVEQQYQQMLQSDPSLAGKPVTFQVTGTAIPAGASSNFPYPSTENWQKAIGAHQIWNSATVTVTPPESPGGEPTFSMHMTLHAEDRYNFNPGAADIETGTPDAANGRFEKTGLAKQYTNYASLERDVRWTPSTRQTPSVSEPEGR